MNLERSELFWRFFRCGAVMSLGIVQGIAWSQPVLDGGLIKPSRFETEISKVKSAHEIRKVLMQWMQQSPELVRANLPRDWAHALPVDVGPVQSDGADGLLIGVWRVTIDRSRAQLTYYPPGAMTANVRAWFLINLLREPDGWKIRPPGVAFVRARRAKGT